MTYRGTVRNGLVELEPGIQLADGTVVHVLLESAGGEPQGDASDSGGASPLVKYARLARVTGLPPDLSEQHDHYVHGTPKT